jgi:hypothetical protein
VFLVKLRADVVLPFVPRLVRVCKVCGNRFDSSKILHMSVMWIGFFTVPKEPCVEKTRVAVGANNSTDGQFRSLVYICHVWRLLFPLDQAILDNTSECRQFGSFVDVLASCQVSEKSCVER